VTQFAGALRAQLNLQAGTENTQSVSPNSGWRCHADDIAGISAKKWLG